MVYSKRLFKLSLWVLIPFFLALLLANAESKVNSGSEAPNFRLLGDDNEYHSLSDYKDKIVVLEWYNNECPFVKKHYSVQNMQKLQEKYKAKGVVWLSINSSAKGKQGHLTQTSAQKLVNDGDTKASHILLDPEGTVGKLYSAKTTPHMYVIDGRGKLAYQGAIDSNSSYDSKDIPSSTNYVEQALEEMFSDKPVKVASTKSYGCSVKY